MMKDAFVAVVIVLAAFPAARTNGQDQNLRGPLVEDDQQQQTALHGRAPFVQESDDRIYCGRHCTMHSDCRSFFCKHCHNRTKRCRAFAEDEEDEADEMYRQGAFDALKEFDNDDDHDFDQVMDAVAQAAENLDRHHCGKPCTKSRHCRGFFCDTCSNEGNTTIPGICTIRRFGCGEPCVTDEDCNGWVCKYCTNFGNPNITSTCTAVDPVDDEEFCGNDCTSDSDCSGFCPHCSNEGVLGTTGFCRVIVDDDIIDDDVGTFDDGNMDFSALA